MGGCVTTERGGVGSQVEKSQALKDTVQLAFSYIRAGNWPAAKRHLKTALALDDNNAQVYEAMALVFQNTGEIDLAEQNYQRSIKLDSTASRVRNNYAAFLGQQNRYAEAVVQLELVVADTLYNNRPAAFVSLGQSHLQLKQLESARESFRRAFLMNRNNVPVTFYLAEVNYKLNNYALSQQYYDSYRAAVKQQPARALWLGIRLADEFTNNDALSSYGMALKNLYPNSQEYLDYKKVYGI
jgi:type IV pilus assembly protein PilF